MVPAHEVHSDSQHEQNMLEHSQGTKEETWVRSECLSSAPAKHDLFFAA
jgi:hypothetical protein